MRKIQLFEPQTGERHAGSKAPGDVQTIAAEAGFEPFMMHRHVPRNRLWFPAMRFCRLLQRHRYRRDIPRDAVLFVQFPTSLVGGGFNRPMTELIRTVKAEKGHRIVSLIHDVECIRGKSNPLSQPMSEDLRFWSETADVLLVHNKTMADWFVRNGVPREKLAALDLFDYLVPGFAPARDGAFRRSVCVAGNLMPSKAGYLRELASIPDVDWDLYGPNFDSSPGDGRVHYHGVFPPEKLPTVLESGFGLVWDGESTETCAGGMGEYLRINTPHKLSLYLAAGLPVIVWEEAAVADFVQTYGIGISVQSLLDIPNALGRLSESDYSALKRNTLAVSEKLRSGFFTKTALAKALAILDNTAQRP